MARRSYQLVCLLLAVLHGAGSASPGPFLAKRVADDDVGDLFQKVALLSRLEESLGVEHRRATEARVARIIDDLRDTFASLPKSSQGTLGAPAARYAIHRYFVQRHGWHIKGLAPAGQAWSSSSPVAALGDRMPEDVHSIFEEHLGAHGFDLHEVAVLAATLENLIHGEAEVRLESTYEKLLVDANGTLAASDAMDIVDTYLQAIALSWDISNLTSAQVRYMRSNIDRLFPYWQDARAWLREVQRDVAPDLASMAFADVARIVEAVSERYGRQADKDCQDIQEKLLQLEEPGTGRVRLRDFYASVAERGFWNFRESLEYLRHAGVIDESEASVPRVIIPNYLQMQSNCLRASEYYGICCMDRCEGMMSQLERELQAPSAEPGRIASIVAALPSASVPPNRTLPAELVGKLEAVAAQHGGVVPLHGRLFAQWMHYAYPRECAYPHISNTTGGMEPTEWSRSTGLKHTLTTNETAALAGTMQAPAARENGAEPEEAEDGGGMGMWVEEEELVDALAWSAAAAAEASGRQEPQAAVVAALPVRQVLGLFALLALVMSSAVAIRDLVAQAGAVARDPSAVVKPRQQNAVRV